MMNTARLLLMRPAINFSFRDPTHNLLTNPEDISNASWTKNAGSVGTGTTAPDGVSDAKLYIPNTTSTGHTVLHSYTAAAGMYTFYVYLKAGGYSRGDIHITDNTTGQMTMVFNLNTGTVNAATASGSWTSVYGTISSLLRNGFYKLSITGVQGAGTAPAAVIQLQDNSGASPFAGDGTSGIYIWGAQVAPGSRTW
jgi:hypothetical protein